MVEKGKDGMRAWKTAEERLVKASRKKRDKSKGEKRFLRGVVIGAIFVIICLAVATTYMWQSAEAKTKDARALNLNLQSSSLSKYPRTLEKSILLAIESFRIRRTLDVIS